EDVAVARHRDAAHLAVERVRGVPARRGAAEAPVRAGGPLGERDPLVLARALDPDRRARDRQAPGERGDGEADRVRLLECGEAQVRHLHAHPRALARAVEAAEADQIGAGALLAGNPRDMRTQIEAEAGRLPVAAERERDQRRDRWRAERRDVALQLHERDGAERGVRRRLLARAGRPLRLVHGDGPRGKGPEGAVERVEAVQAEIEALLPAPIERHHLRAEALDQALRDAPAEVARLAREVDPQLALA